MKWKEQRFIYELCVNFFYFIFLLEDKYEFGAELSDKNLNKLLIRNFLHKIWVEQIGDTLSLLNEDQDCLT